MTRKVVWHHGKGVCLLALVCTLALAVAGFGGVAQTAAAEPATVGQATNLRASTVNQEDGVVRLTWTAAQDAQVYFVVYLKTTELNARNFGQVQMVPFSGTEGTISGLEGGTEYSFIVTGMRWNWVNYGAVWGTWSAWATATPLGTTAGTGTQLSAAEPATVGQATNLRASTANQGDGAVRLTWTAAQDAQVYFVVYLKTTELNARNFGQVQMVPFSGTEGTISGLEGGTEYSFIVTGMRWNWVNYGAVWGTWSAWATGTPAGSGVVSGPESAVDRAALVSLYNATGGTNWTSNTNWLSNAPIEEWHGVTTDDGGRVTELRLRENNLNGGIPSAVGNLAGLIALDFRGNQLSGGVPMQLGALSNLKVLDLRENELSGEIPTELGDLSSLENLRLRNNDLSGPIPASLGNLTNLKELWLSLNKLSGLVPPEIGNLRNLEIILMTENQLSGSLPDSLGNLSALRRLEIVGNQLSGPIPTSLGDLSSLERLRLGNNELTGPIPPQLGNLSSLKLLELNGSALRGPIPSELGSLSSLEELRLYENQLSGPIPPELGNLSNLQSLNLRSNSLSGVIPLELGRLSNLTYLSLRSNDLSGAIPSQLGNLSDLEELYLYGNRLSGSIPSSLGNLSNVRIFFLHENQLTEQIPASLGSLASVERLSLRHNQLTGPVPATLGDLPNLELLRLDYNQLWGQIPSELGRLSKLTRLDLDNNHLMGSIPPSLGDLSELRTLDLHDNLLTGEVPDTLSALTKLEAIRLSGTALIGCIPAALQNVADSDLTRLALPLCGVQADRQFSTDQLATLFDEIITNTEQRDAFSPIKESNIGFSPIEDMRKLRPEFIEARTETDLYYALLKLSNARRDAHLRVESVEGGLAPPRRASCVGVPVHVLPDLSDVNNPTFFVAQNAQGRTSPTIGDVLVSVNGRSMAEYVDEFTPWIRHSTLDGLYWRMADHLTEMHWYVPPSLYSRQLDLTLEGPNGQRYDVSLPYSYGCYAADSYHSTAGFDRVMERVNFNVLVDRDRQLVLLQWRDFERDDLIQDIPALMQYAQQEQILDYDMIIDVSRSSGGSGGAYAIQRLVDQPFRVTFGNVRLSDLGRRLVEYFAGLEPDASAPDVPDWNLSRSWLIDWAQTDGLAAINRGDEYTAPVPFKLAHLPRDSDGMLQPAPVHFRGDVAIINARTAGGSHLDQFMAMFVDNDLATFIGMPTGGYSNTWERRETLRLPGSEQPLFRFMWSIGHTIRPNGEILEGNSAQPDIYIPITRDNFQGYHQMLFDRALAELGR